MLTNIRAGTIIRSKIRKKNSRKTVQISRRF